MLAKLCKENSTNKVVAFKNAAFIALANDDVNKAVEIKNYAKECSLPENAISEVSFEILKDLGKNKRWEAYEDALKELEANPKNHPQLIRPYEDLRKEFVSIANTDEARAIVEKQNRFYQNAKNQKLDIPVEALDLISERMLSSVVVIKNRLDQKKL
jgi:hypothetical protein